MNYLNLSSEKLAPTVNSLNLLLANYHIYYQNLRSHHWNIQGENFFDLHNKFEELYDGAKIEIDEIAERILTLRKKPVSRLIDYMDMAEISEPEKGLDDHKMVENILDNHSKLISNMRKAIEHAGAVHDEGTVDMISGMLGRLEKASWMLEAWLVRKEEHAELSK